MPTIVVDVMPKAELLDPQGKAVAGCARAARRRRLQLACASASASSSPSRARSPRRPRQGPRDRRRDPLELGDRGRRRHRGRGVSARIGVITFPGSLDDRDAQRAIRIAGGRAGRALARLARPRGRRRARAARRLQLRRLPARRCDRRTRADHGRSEGCRGQRACRCSASATGSRCSSRRICCRAGSSATRTSSSSAATSACASRTPRPPGRRDFADGPGDRHPAEERRRRVHRRGSETSTGSRARDSSRSATSA